jgi:putative endonuclease
MHRTPAVYMLASKNNGVLYIGLTSDLVKRIYQHKKGEADGFTRRYNIHKLVYYELHGSMEAAITREKQIKKWNRGWKIRLIGSQNPDWIDIYPEII